MKLFHSFNLLTNTNVNQHNMSDTTDVLDRGLLILAFQFCNSKYYERKNDLISPDKVLDFLRSIEFDVEECQLEVPFELRELNFGVSQCAMVKYVCDDMTENDCIVFMQKINEGLCEKGGDIDFIAMYGDDVLKKIINKISDQSIIHTLVLLYCTETEMMIDRCEDMCQTDDIETFYGDFTNFLLDYGEMSPEKKSSKLMSYIYDTFISRTSHMVKIDLLYTMYDLHPNKTMANIIVNDARFLEWICSEDNHGVRWIMGKLWDLIELYERTYSTFIEISFSISMFFIVGKNRGFFSSLDFKQDIIQSHIDPLVNGYLKSGRNFLNDLKAHSKKNKSYKKIYQYFNGPNWLTPKEYEPLLIDFMEEKLNS